MKWDDPRFCDGTRTCQNGLDEFCQSVVVIGSDKMDGVYSGLISANTFKQMGGVNLIHKVGRGWQDDQGNPIPLVKILEERANLEEKAFVFEGGFVCQSARQLKNWLFLTVDDERRCDATTHCQSGFDEEVSC